MSALQCFYGHPIFSANILETLLLKWSKAESAKYKIIHERWVLNAGNKMYTCLFLASPFLGIKKSFSGFCFACLEENL